MATPGSRVRQAICDAPGGDWRDGVSSSFFERESCFTGSSSLPAGKLKAALQLKVHFGCWRAQKSEEDDILGKPVGCLYSIEGNWVAYNC